MSWFCIFLILTHNHFAVEKINHSLEFIGTVIIMLSMESYINLLNRNLVVFFQNLYRLSTRILSKYNLIFRSMNNDIEHHLNILLPKASRLSGFTSLWLHDTLNVGHHFPKILLWTWFKSCEGIIYIHVTVLSHLTLNIAWEQSGESL